MKPVSNQGSFKHPCSNVFSMTAGDISWGTTTRKSCDLWSHGHMKSRDELKTIYLHFHEAYVCQTWPGRCLVPPSIEYFNALIMWSSDHVTDEKRYIWPSARPVTSKLDKVEGFIACLLFTTSLNLFITCSHKVIWQLKNVINSLSRNLWL